MEFDPSNQLLDDITANSRIYFYDFPLTLHFSCALLMEYPGKSPEKYKFRPIGQNHAVFRYSRPYRAHSR